MTTDKQREAYGDVLVEQRQGDCIQRITIPNARLVQAASVPMQGSVVVEAIETAKSWANSMRVGGQALTSSEVAGIIIMHLDRAAAALSSLPQPVATSGESLSAEAKVIYEKACENWAKDHSNEGLTSIMQAVVPCSETMRYCLEAGAEIMRDDLPIGESDDR